MSATMPSGKNEPDTTREDAPPTDQPDLGTFAERYGTTDTLDAPEYDAPAPDAHGFDTSHVPVAIPEQFVDAYGHHDTLADALAAAENAPTTTDRDTLGVCTQCFSVRLKVKTGADAQLTHDAAVVCTSCRAHLSTPGGATDFDTDARPADPRRPLIPVEVGDNARYHVAGGCTAGGAVEHLAAAEALDRGLRPCAEPACLAAGVVPRRCQSCGGPTFGAVDGIPQTVCADCTVVSADE